MPAPPSAEGNLDRDGISQFPSIGGVPAGRGGKRVQNWVLNPHCHRGYWLLVTRYS